MYESFQQLLESRKLQKAKKVAIIWPFDEHTLEAAKLAVSNIKIDLILIGEETELNHRLNEMNFENRPQILSASNPEDAVHKAIELALNGEVNVLMKGLLETSDMMRQMVKKENRMCASGVMSHLSLIELPSYHKLIGVTDCALMTYPTVKQKGEIIRNSVSFLNSIGINPVKTAVLAAVEKLNPKMPETIDASQLKEEWLLGEFPGCIIEGPISYDLSISKEAADIKGYSSEVAGDADLLVVPNIVAGNILVKSLTLSACGFGATMVLGAKVPIVVTSRSSSIKTKYNSLCVASSII